MRSQSSALHQPALDAIVAELQRLRVERGGMSYTQIAELVRQLRADRGEAPASAFVGRSTIYDAFRLGRRRLNPDLVADIATVLGEDAERVAAWRNECLSLRRTIDDATRHDREGLIEPHTDALADDEPHDALSRRPAFVVAPRPPAESPRPVRDPRVEVLKRATDPSARERDGHRSLRARPMLRAIVPLVVVGTIINLVGSGLVVILPLSVYLDMIGTAVVALLCGPWTGVAVAIATHGLFALVDGSPTSLWFVLVNITGALVWGYGARLWPLARTPLRMLFLSTGVALCCTFVAVVLMGLVYGGASLHAEAQGIADGLSASGYTLATATTMANLITSVIDKIVSGFIALSIAPVLARLLLPAGSVVSEVSGIARGADATAHDGR